MRFWHLFISAAILSSCSVPDGDRMPILIDAVIDGDTSEYSFRKGDRMGLYAVCPAGEMASAGNCVDNAEFTYDGSSWSSERQILWTDDVTPADLYCYCPYRENLEDAGNLFSRPGPARILRRITMPRSSSTEKSSMWSRPQKP